MAAGAPSLVVAPVAAHDGLDDATVQFLLQQSLLARAQEEEEAREREEVMLLEEKVKEKERRIVEEIDRLRALGQNDRSPLLFRTCGWYVARRDLLAKKEKMKRKRKKRRKKKLPKSSSTRFSRGMRGRRCSWTLPPPGIGGVGFGSSPYLDTKHTFYEFCLPSERSCVAVSCGGRFCSFDGAYGSVWDRVKPMTGKFLLFPIPRSRWVYLHAEFLVQQLRRDLRRQLQLFSVYVEGQVSQ